MPPKQMAIVITMTLWDAGTQTEAHCRATCLIGRNDETLVESHDRLPRGDVAAAEAHAAVFVQRTFAQVREVEAQPFPEEANAPASA